MLMLMPTPAGPASTSSQRVSAIPRCTSQLGGAEAAQSLRVGGNPHLLSTRGSLWTRVQGAAEGGKVLVFRDCHQLTRVTHAHRSLLLDVFKETYFICRKCLAGELYCVLGVRLPETKRELVSACFVWYTLHSLYTLITYTLNTAQLLTKKNQEGHFHPPPLKQQQQQ